MNLGQTGRVRPDARLFGALVALVATLGLTVWGLTGGTSAATGGTGGIAGTASNPLTSATTGHGAYTESSTLTSSAQGPPTAPSGYHLIFNPSFAGSTLNRAVWDTCYPYKQWGNGANGCTNFGNHEYEWYLPQQVKQSGGILQIFTTKAVTSGPHVVAPDGTPGTPPQIKGVKQPDAPATYYCRSGLVNTYPSHNFEYGIVQVVAKMSGSNGMWPALWLAASNRGWPPEVDLMEHFFQRTRLTAQFNHYALAPNQHRAGGPASARVAEWWYTADLGVGWHTYTLVWTPTELAWYVDGRVSMTTFQNIPHQDMYFVANMAALQQPPKTNQLQGESCSGTLDIRSVKIWQQA
jgi:hypothetical protein